MKTVFKCPKCGEYAVTEDMFNAFVTPGQQEKIMQVPNATKARLEFSDGCPKCLPSGQTHTRVATLSVARPKRG